jgi:hypothetical protein
VVRTVSNAMVAMVAVMPVFSILTLRQNRVRYEQ